MNQATMKRRAAGQRWALVLAAGDGTRLGHLTRDASGRPTPKQFCSVSGGPTLLEETLHRGANIAGAGRVVAVVADKHRAWWSVDTATLPAEDVIVQPLNRGTAAGVLLPLLHIADRDADARVVVLPSDHYIEREEVLQGAIRAAFEAVERSPCEVVLLGISPGRPDPELGWILPRACRGRGVTAVERFVEKPPLPTARALQRRGGLWNSFIFVGRVGALLDLYRRRLPALLEQLTAAVAWERASGRGAGVVASVYEGLESRDFSRDILQAEVDSLRVLAVAPCGWSDLGTPERLARCAMAIAPALSVTHYGLRPVLAGVV